MAGISECAKTGNGVAPPITCFGGIITTVINLAFMFVGGACLIFLLIGAIKFITSSGDPKAVKSARDTMTYAVVGTIIVLSAYLIVHVVGGTFLPGTIDLLNITPTP